jgi:hypothetical protein
MKQALKSVSFFLQSLHLLIIIYYQDFAAFILFLAYSFATSKYILSTNGFSFTKLS